MTIINKNAFLREFLEGSNNRSIEDTQIFKNLLMEKYKLTEMSLFSAVVDRIAFSGENLELGLNKTAITILKSIMKTVSISYGYTTLRDFLYIELKTQKLKKEYLRIVGVDFDEHLVNIGRYKNKNETIFWNKVDYFQEVLDNN